MGYLLLISLALITSTLFAYTMEFQGATLRLGKRLAPDNPCLPRGMQDAITPKAQSIRNGTWPLMLVGVFAYAMHLTTWYYAILAVIATLALSGVIGLAMPKPESGFFVARIKRDLQSRLAKFRRQKDVDRQEAAIHLLDQIEWIEKNDSGRSAPR